MYVCMYVSLFLCMCIYTFLPLTAIEWIWPWDNCRVTTSSQIIIIKNVFLKIKKKQKTKKTHNTLWFWPRASEWVSVVKQTTMGERSAAVPADRLVSQHDRQLSGRKRGPWRKYEDRRDRCVWRCKRRLFCVKTSTELVLKCACSSGWLNQSPTHTSQGGRQRYPDTQTPFTLFHQARVSGIIQ